MLDDVSYSPKWKGDPTKYLEAKLKILMDNRGFCITPTETELKYLQTLKTQTAIDNAILSIIDKRWG
jgi:hypothetical protein